MRVSQSLLLLPVLALLAPAQSDRRQPRGEPGVFDFYVLALSWSPEFCSGPGAARNRDQCGEGRKFAFITHGLWPQYEKGWPQFCAPGGPVAREIVEKTMPVMPSAGLMRHQWEKHGTCSGLEQGAYFDAVRRAFKLVRIPSEFEQPLKEINQSPAKIPDRFAAANPSFGREAFRVRCSGRFLSEVWVCLTKDLKGRACPASLRDACRADPVIVRPVR